MAIETKVLDFKLNNTFKNMKSIWISLITSNVHLDGCKDPLILENTLDYPKRAKEIFQDSKNLL